MAVATSTGVSFELTDDQKEYRTLAHDFAEGEIRPVAAEADQQAKLHNLAVSQDTALVTVWGFRLSWFSVFPNVVDVEMVQTNVERRRALANRLAGAVLEELRKKGAVQSGAGLHEDTAKAIEAVLAEQEIRPAGSPK